MADMENCIQSGPPSLFIAIAITIMGKRRRNESVDEAGDNDNATRSGGKGKAAVGKVAVHTPNRKKTRKGQALSNLARRLSFVIQSKDGLDNTERPLEGMIFGLDGRFHRERKEVIKLIREKGGEVLSRFTKKATHLLSNHEFNGSKKHKKTTKDKDQGEENEEDEEDEDNVTKNYKQAVLWKKSILSESQLMAMLTFSEIPESKVETEEKDWKTNKRKKRATEEKKDEKKQKEKEKKRKKNTTKQEKLAKKNNKKTKQRDNKKKGRKTQETTKPEAEVNQSTLDESIVCDPDKELDDDVDIDAIFAAVESLFGSQNSNEEEQPKEQQQETTCSFKTEENEKEEVKEKGEAEEEEEKEEKSGEYSGRTYLFVGKHKQLSRLKAREFIEERGGRVAASQNRKVTHLIAAQTSVNSVGYKRAIERGAIPIFEEEFITEMERAEAEVSANGKEATQEKEKEVDSRLVPLLKSRNMLKLPVTPQKEARDCTIRMSSFSPSWKVCFRREEDKNKAGGSL
ncbi:Major sperm protein [Balamuthia mandrillaris]